MSCFIIVYVITGYILVLPVEGGGTGRVQFLSYTNPTYKDANGQCCETTGTSGCHSNECDPFFEFCVGEGCKYGRVKTSTYDNRDSVVFGSRIGTMSNPVVFHFDSLPAGLRLSMAVTDHDSFGGDDEIGRINKVLTGPPDPNGKLVQNKAETLAGGMAKIAIQHSFVCDQYYYGDCTVMCKPSPQQYTCSNSGQKVCRPGWTGKDCNIKDDSCRWNPCQHGGTCIDNTNHQHKCTCLNEWTGHNCENRTQRSTTAVASTKSIITTTTSTISTTASTSSTLNPTSSAGKTTMIPTSRMFTSPATQTDPVSTIPPVVNQSTRVPLTLTSSTSTSVPSMGSTIPDSRTSPFQEQTSFFDYSSTSSTNQKSSTNVFTTSQMYSSTSELIGTTVDVCVVHVKSRQLNGTTLVDIIGINKTNVAEKEITRTLQYYVNHSIIHYVQTDNNVWSYDLMVNRVDNRTILEIENELCQKISMLASLTEPRKELNGNKDAGGGSSGGVIGGVIGGICVLAVLGAIGFILYRRWKNKSKVHDEETSTLSDQNCEMHDKLQDTGATPITSQSASVLPDSVMENKNSESHCNDGEGLSNGWTAQENHQPIMP